MFITHVQPFHVLQYRPKSVFTPTSASGVAELGRGGGRKKNPEAKEREGGKHSRKKTGRRWGCGGKGIGGKGCLCVCVCV